MTSISVVIPALNDAELLRTCLEALRQQNRPADEIIVVDNGSEDATAAVARAAGVTVLTQPIRGIFVASALGYNAAASDIIARLDADSIPAPDWLEVVERELDRGPSLSAITGPASFYGGPAVWRWFGEHIYIPSYYLLMKRLTGHTAVFGSNFAMHREVWESVRASVDLSDPELHDDMHLTIQLGPEVTVRYVSGLSVGVSARPFSSIGAIAQRVRWGRHTIRRGAMERRYSSRRAEFRRLHPRQRILPD